MLSAGAAHTCGLADGGQLACWGENLGGQLGDGSREDRLTPAIVSTPTFESVVSGWNHTCAVTRTGVLYCWGLNREGQVGDGSRLDGLAPKPIATSVGVLAAGNSHTCATSGIRLLCWGDNRFGQLGDGTTDSRLDPTPVVGLPGTPVTIVAGASHTCALLSDGTAHCWGQNLHGQLGDSSTTNATTPVPVAGGHVFAHLVAGGAVTCGRTVDGVEYCWGLNQSGQLGDGTLDSRQVPTRVRG
jgi:alpha-tubulin suppressor-like RCC1 family protein